MNSKRILALAIICIALQSYSSATTTILSQGCRNPKFPNGGGGFIAYGGATAVGDGVADDTQAIRDWMDKGRYAGGGWWNPAACYLPPGTYKVTGMLVFRNPTLYFGEPSARPKIVLAASSGSYNSGSTPFCVTDGSWGYQETDYTAYTVRDNVHHATTNNIFNLDIRDIDFQVLSGNPGCSSVFMFATAQQCSLRNTVLTGDSATASCLAPGDPSAGGGGSGGGIMANITCNGGQSAVTQFGGGSYLVYRGCTFNGAVNLASISETSLIACTINNPGGAGFSNSGSNFNMVDCTFTSGTPFNRGSRYHIENSGPPGAGFVTQESGGDVVYYNGTPEAGNNNNLAVAGVAKGSPYVNPAYPYAPSNTVQITSGGDITTALRNAFAVAGASVYLPPGGYSVSGTVNIGPNQRLYGAGIANTSIYCSASPAFVVNATGGPVVLASLDIEGNTDTYIQWDGDSTSLSQLVDMRVDGTYPTNGPSFLCRSGSLMWENSLSLADGVESYGPTFQGTNPVYLYSFAPEHYGIYPIRLINAQNVTIVGLDMEAPGAGYGGAGGASWWLWISGGSKNYIMGIANSGDSTVSAQDYLAYLTNNPKCSIWMTLSYSSSPTGQVTENGVGYGSGGGGQMLVGYVHPSVVIGVAPTLTVGSATSVTQTSATLNGSITSNGGATITGDGFNWGTTTGYGNSVAAGTVPSGSFSIGITGLSPSQIYYYQSFASNNAGTGVSPNPPSSFTTLSAAGGPFVQAAMTTGGTTSTATQVGVPFASPQTAGNTNVVAVSFFSPTSTVSISDTLNNTYQIASPIIRTATDSQIVYYCPSIAGSATTNNVTVTLGTASNFISVRAAEYHGLGAIDKQSEQTGSGTTASVPSFVTTNAKDLIVVATCADMAVNGASTGFIERLNGNPYGSNLSDDYTSATGSFTAQTPISGSTGWLENAVAFLPAGAPTPTPTPVPTPTPTPLPPAGLHVTSQ